METDISSLKKTARFAGLLYLIWIVTGLYGLFYIPSQINMSGDAATTSQNILSNELLFRSGMINDIISSVLWVLLALTLYRLFKQTSARQARLMVALVIVQVPAVYIMGAFNIASLMILKGEVMTALDSTQSQDLATLFLRINDYGTLVLEMFWGLWLFPLAILVYRSRFMPRFLGVWLTITGLFYVVLSTTSLLLPQYGDAVTNSVLALPAELGEVAFMLWLVIMGVWTKPSVDRV